MSTELDLGWFDPQLGALQRPDATGLGTGLSRSIANRLGVDVVLVRVVFVVLAFCSGLGLALYGWGTVLTRGPQGTRPVDQFLPGFRTWSPFAQKVLVLATTIALIATIGAAFPLPWGAGVLVLIVLAVARRQAKKNAAPPAGWYPPPSAPAAPAAAGPQPAHAPLDDQTLVAQWRNSITEAVGTHIAAVPLPQLPEVDLYAPDEPAPRPAAPQAKPGWVGGLLVLGAMIAVTAIASGALGWSGVVSLAAATAAGGLATIVFALATRQRRIPRLILAALAVPIVATGWLATEVSAGAGPEPARTHTVRIVAEDTVVDLREMDLSGIDTVRIDALLSDVRVILPGPVESLSANTWMGDITDTTAAPSADNPMLKVNVEVTARLADVTLKDQP